MIKIISGKVIKGNQKGRKLGFRTANISLLNNEIEYGVYKINIITDNNIYFGVGVYLECKGVFESHIFNFNQNIYGKNIEVVLLKKIRNNKKFNSLEELKNQIEKDIKIVKSIKINVLTFGTFDLVHKGHKYYLNNAKKYGDSLITIIGTDKNVKNNKGKYPLKNEEIRKKDIEKLGISNYVFIGDEKDPYKCIKKYNINVICLGYDQLGYSLFLEKYILENNLNISVFRIKPFNEKVYKSSKLKEINK